VGDYLLDTEVASRLMRAERKAVTSLRPSSAKSISISSITMAELLYGTRLREDAPSVMAAVRASAVVFDIMIAAHAEALSMTLVTSVVAIKNLKIEGLKIS
jgi:predicted nucleic acid-binding protein